MDIQEALAYALFTFVGQFSGEMTRLKINDFKNCDIPRKQRLVFDWGGRSEKDFLTTGKHTGYNELPINNIFEDHCALLVININLLASTGGA